MPIPHLLVMESMVIHRHGTLAMTGRAHCQRQVAFFFIFPPPPPQIINGLPLIEHG